MDSKELYSDVNSKKMIRSRKIGLYLGYIMTFLVISGHSLMYIVYFVDHSNEKPFTTNLIMMIVWILSTILFYWMLSYLFIRDSKLGLRHGIILQKDMLRLFGKKIPVPDIFEAEVVMFPNSFAKYFSINYAIDSKKGKKIETRIVRKSETENIYDLRDKIRDIRGWSPQGSPQRYKWREWKDRYQKQPKDNNGIGNGV
jgi:hypothetical protein